MIKHIFLIAIVSLVFSGCKKDSKTPTSGVITLSSQKIGTQTFYVYGFSVSTGSLVQFSLGSAGNIPDWVLEDFLDVGGNPVGANITTNPQNTQAFCINGSYGNQTDAAIAFSAYKDVVITTPTDKITDIKPYQMYTYKDKAGKYTKFLIETLEKKSSGSTSYFEASIRWVYQPDGTKHFSE